jgi:nicotinamide-nucleotide amidase
VGAVLPPELTEPAAAIAARLRERGETIALAESSAAGLVTASLVAFPGASAYFAGAVTIYTFEGVRALLGGGPPLPDPLRSASEPFAGWLASAVAAKLGAGWGFGETGASGPDGNPYGDPAGHAWVAVRRPGGEVLARHVLTGETDRAGNMVAFAAAGLGLLLEALERPEG